MENDLDDYIAIECHSCDSRDVDLKEFKQRYMGNEIGTVRYCKLCAGSMAGNLYENQCGSDAQHLAGIICYVGNEILKAIKDQKS